MLIDPRISGGVYDRVAVDPGAWLQPGRLEPECATALVSTFAMKSPNGNVLLRDFVLRLPVRDKPVPQAPDASRRGFLEIRKGIARDADVQFNRCGNRQR